MARKYDVVLFGATGFTGGLVADYFAEKAEIKPDKLALAGRSRHKLEAVRKRMATINTDYASIGLVEADIENPASIQAMANSTVAVATTVGPYIFYGEPLLKACADAGTHYADLTGEPEFVDRMRIAHDQTARRTLAKIVNCCGFDSIPHDAGVFYTIQQFGKRFDTDTSAVELQIHGYLSSKGTFSGGTLHSAVHAFSRAPQYMKWRKQHISELRDTSPGRKIRSSETRLHRPETLSGWAVPLPTIDPQIVLRTAATSPEYGKSFRYGHFALVQKLRTVAAGAAGITALFAAAQLPPLRNRILKLKAPGQGPDAETRAKSRFSVDFIATDGSNNLHTRVSGGDPGYQETAKMLAETVTCLATDQNLPKASGILTPVQATGELLVARLLRSGITFEIVN